MTTKEPYDIYLNVLLAELEKRGKPLPGGRLREIVGDEAQIKKQLADAQEAAAMATLRHLVEHHGFQLAEAQQVVDLFIVADVEPTFVKQAWENYLLKRKIQTGGSGAA